MTHGSLFSGIGGFELAAKWMGWDNIFHCEWNEFGQKVLKHHFPKSISYADITKTDFSIHRGAIDILTGGFPCQPYSTAGKRLGKEDERHLWPEMLRAIREIKPRWVVGENVRGLISWSGGLVFEEVCTDLEAQGYNVQPFLLPAASVNAPHKRDRVWFVAYSNNDRICNGFGQVQSENGKISERNDNAKSGNTSSSFEGFPTKSPICNGNDGLPDRLDSITFPKWRNESIKAGGNAIVPQVAHQIFKAIQDYEQHYGSRL
jgi:DNA (cytosine-5)-methyltransferase 1